jgi:DNA-binding CsgD family transcriptional regulator
VESTVGLTARRPDRGRDGVDAWSASVLDSLSWLFSCALAFTYTVDEGGAIDATMLRCAAGCERREAAALINRLRRLEAIDPFSPRRAAACRAAVMSIADVGGNEAYARSLHAQHLSRYGYGAPLALYLRRDGRIAAAIMLLRGSDAPAFDAAAVRLLHRLQPLVEDAFELAAEPPATEPAATRLVAELTTRQAEIAQLVAGGARNAEIAAALDVSEVTVKTHLTKVYAKLGVRSRTQLAVAMGDGG